MKHVIKYSNWSKLNEAANGKFQSSELTKIPVQSGDSQSHALNPQAAADYSKMVDAAKADGVSWGITDSYRPFSVQDRIFDWDLFNRTGKKAKKGTGGRVAAAYPGTSNHGWGSAVDLKVKKGDQAHTWLTQNASRFGFSPLASEPWHWDHKSSASNYKAGAEVTVPTQTQDQSTVTSTKVDTSTAGASTTISNDELSKFKTLITKLRSTDYSAKLGDISLLTINNTLNSIKSGDIATVNMEDIKNGLKKLISGNTGQQVFEIQRKLKELGLLKKEPTGEFDSDTFNAIKDFQTKKNLSVTGEVDKATYAAMYELARTDSGKIKVNQTGTKAENIKLLLTAMDRHGITNNFTKKAILAVIGKESGYVPKNEYSYSNTSNARLRKLFGARLSQFSESELSSLKANNVDFYDVIYGYKQNPKPKWNTGNTEPGDGYKYRGRGFNGITFKTLYQKFQKLLDDKGKIGKVDILSNPDNLNDPNIAAEAAVLYFIDRASDPLMGRKYGVSDINGFTDQTTALKAMTNANAGWGRNIEGSEDLARAQSKLNDFSSNLA